MNLVIVESPAKSKTIEKFLGPEYRVLSSYGHIRDLPEDKIGVDTKNDFKPEYIIIPRAKKTLKLLNTALKKADLTLLATDPDREGEAIAWHLTQALNLDGTKPYQRIVFHEITKSAVEEALRNPRKIDMNLVAAQQARRILDRLVGYKLSPFLWRKVLRGLSAGRVQSVAVRLIAEREKEIKNFKSDEYWTIAALLRKLKMKNERFAPYRPAEIGTGAGFEAILIKKDGKVIPKLGIKSKKEADEIVRDIDGAEYKVINVEKKEVKKNPLPPLTTSTLQQEAWRKFHFSAKMTMSIAQALYEKGFITYHRTDSLNLSDQSLFDAKKFIVENYGENYWAGFLRRYKTKSKNAQEAHEAIRPTYPDNSPEKISEKPSTRAKLGDGLVPHRPDEIGTGAGLEKNQLKLYDLIWRRFISCQMSQAISDSTIIDISAKNPAPYRAEGSSAGYIFRASGQILKFDGFLKVYPMKFAASVGGEPRPIGREEIELPSLKKDEILELIKLIPSQHFTQPPSRYSEATLVKTLENYGIGRPSTYAPIIETIQERGYVKKDEKKLFYPSEIGFLVNDILIQHFPRIVDINFTAGMEEELDKIAGAEMQWLHVIRNFYIPFEKNLKEKYKEVSKTNLAEETKEKCPECGKNLVIRVSKYGKFYACSDFPKCKYKKDIPISLAIKCPKCGKGEIVERRTRKRKIFYGCSRWPECDFALWDKPLPGRQAGTGEFCPKCGSLLVKTRWGKVKCSNPNCETNLALKKSK